MNKMKKNFIQILIGLLLVSGICYIFTTFYGSIFTRVKLKKFVNEYVVQKYPDYHTSRIGYDFFDDEITKEFFANAVLGIYPEIKRITVFNEESTLEITYQYTKNDKFYYMKTIITALDEEVTKVTIIKNTNTNTHP